MMSCSGRSSSTREKPASSAARATPVVVSRQLRQYRDHLELLFVR